MIRYFTVLTILLFSFQLSLVSQSNLFIDNGYTAEEMVDAFFNDSDVIPSNASFTGNSLGMAFFDAGDTDMDINAGILLSSGIVYEAANPAGFFASTNLSAPGDTDLEMQVNDGFPSFDASILEMDITPFTDSICFYYVFASEEYPEWVFSNFNDVFAFFISGGPEYSEQTNLAIVPDTAPDGVPVSINTINQNLFSNYYIPQYVDNNGIIDYLPDTDLSYDGMTVLLPAKAYVTPGETYHIKIGITDVSDGIFDSGVFIGVQSLGGDSLLTPIADATLTVEDNNLLIENESMFAKSFAWNFGDGVTSTLRHPGNHEYEEAGTYDVELTVSSWCCSATYSEEVVIGELVAPVASFSTQLNEACPQTDINFTDLSTGNVESWAWTFPGGTPESSTEQHPVVSYESPGIYGASLEVTDENGLISINSVEEMLTIRALPEASFASNAQELSVEFINTSMEASSYLWDFGDGNQSTDPAPIHVYENPGNYLVSLTATNYCGESVSTSEVNLVVNNTTDTYLNELEIYPNPVRDILNINPGTISDQYDILLYTIEGRLMMQQPGISGNYLLDMKAFEAGMYLIEIRSPEGTLSKRVLKE